MKRLALAAAAGVFAIFLVSPVAVALLRRHLARELPQAWAAEPMNGRFSVLIPELVGARQREDAFDAARVKQILLHGRPYNPYAREERSLRSWLHRSLGMYILAGWAWACGGRLDLAWITLSAVLGALWFLFYWTTLSWWSGREDVAMPLAFLGALFSPTARVSLCDQLGLFLLALIGLGLWRVLGRGKDEAAAPFALGVGCAVMILVFVHAGVFLLVMLTALTALLWSTGASLNSRRGVLWMLGGGLAAGALYAWLMTAVLDPQTARESLGLKTIEGSLRVLWGAAASLVLAALCLGLFRREPAGLSARRAAWLVLASAGIAVCACAAAQSAVDVELGAGRFLEAGAIVGGMALLLWTCQTLARQNWWDRRLSLSVSLAIVLLGVCRQTHEARMSFRLMGLPQPVEEALRWIDGHVEKDGLVMSLSAQANETIPLLTAAKVQIAPPDAEHASPFTREVYYRRVAGLLKTLDADPGTFLRDRWLPHDSKRALLGRLKRERRLLSRVDLESIEPALWFTPGQAWGGSDEEISAGKLRIIEICRIIKPQPKPYYLWVGREDEAYLTKTPEALGGSLVYMNAKVKLYAFR